MSARSLLLANADDVVDHFELLGAMRVYCQDFENNARQLWRRLLFNWLLHHDGLDLCKVVFLYTGTGRWRLAPACGLLPELKPNLEQAQLPARGLWLDAKLDMLLQKSWHFGIRRVEALDVLQHQLSALQSWTTLAKQFAVYMSDSDLVLLEPVMNNPYVKSARTFLNV
jgi:hypothetical protein